MKKIKRNRSTFSFAKFGAVLLTIIAVFETISLIRDGFLAVVGIGLIYLLFIVFVWKMVK